MLQNHAFDSSAAGDALVLDNPTTAELAAVREWTRDILGARVNDVELVLTELLTNAIVHGSPGIIVVTITPRHGNVVVSVTNPTPRLPRPARLDETISPSGDFSRRGRGLLIAASIAESLTATRSRGTLEVCATVPA